MLLASPQGRPQSVLPHTAVDLAEDIVAGADGAGMTLQANTTLPPLHTGRRFFFRLVEGTTWQNLFRRPNVVDCISRWSGLN
jgi:hypothetical protein